MLNNYLLHVPKISRSGLFQKVIKAFIAAQITPSLDHTFRSYSTSVTGVGYVTGYPLNNRKMAKCPEQIFDYFLVLDFEATCQQGTVPEPQEIIEFPVLKIRATDFKTESIFHKYVQPRVHKELSPFCTELTGIIQDMVDGQPHLEEVLQNFYNWMEKEKLLECKFTFVTMGDWDLNKMLPKQSTYFGIEYPDFLKHWINIKKPYADFVGIYPKGMMPMLAHLGIKHEGRHHSGIDDCKNIAKILKYLGEHGTIFKDTGHLK